MQEKSEFVGVVESSCEAIKAAARGALIPPSVRAAVEEITVVQMALAQAIERQGAMLSALIDHYNANVRAPDFVPGEAVQNG
jgi:hypothetical protein